MPLDLVYRGPGDTAILPPLPQPPMEKKVPDTFYCPRVPRTVAILGIASLCMDLSSEMIHSLLPVFLVSILGAGPTVVGLIEGIGEATASITKIFSGTLSDRLPRRKPLVVAGYGLATLTKPLFPLADSATTVLAARFVDRVGKGIRGAPRDALIADVTPASLRGAAYGLRQSLDSVGALLGPLLAIGAMLLMSGDVRSVLWIATLPSIAAVVVLVWGIEEPARHLEVDPQKRPRWHDMWRLDRRFWSVVAIGALLTLARFSEAFLVLRAHEVGLSLEWTSLALVVMNATFVATAYPTGRLADRVDRFALLFVGTLVLIGADIVLALWSDLVTTLLGIALWGVHMGLTQGLLAAMIAHAAPFGLRGTAFGVFHFVVGCAALLSSAVAGMLWSSFGAPTAFLASAACAAAGACALVWWQGHGRPDQL